MMKILMKILQMIILNHIILMNTKFMVMQWQHQREEKLGLSYYFLNMNMKLIKYLQIINKIKLIKSKKIKKDNF